MHVITFYSYKGGVGRTMAAVNVAVQLAQTGARVLIVDFDLEAPSLMTFNLAGTTQACKGVVDYVLEYQKTGIAPDLKGYVCDSETFPLTGGHLWIMPAGDRGPEYEERRLSIDWQHLYEKQDGYLLIENLKAQWQQTLEPDYVLIDSRTGLNEVMGICTRQLPHAVCLMFVPNPQNLDGLRRVVPGIRAQRRNSEGADIRLHFVASNIPYEDDERGTLEEVLGRYTKELAIPRTFRLHHYRTLALQGQAVFTLSSPQATLSKEYLLLTEQLRMDNLEDRMSALAYVKQLLRTVPEGLPSVPMESSLQLIAQHHRDDPEVLQHLARIKLRLGSATEALVLLDQAIDTGKATAQAYVDRGALHLLQEDPQRLEAAKSDFIEGIERLKSPVSFTDLALPVRSLARLGGVDWHRIARLPAIQTLDANAQISLTRGMDTSDEGMQATRHILCQLKSQSPLSPDEQGEWLVLLALAFIRLQEFEAAITLLRPQVPGPATQADLSPKRAFTLQCNTFNLAIAEWGRSGKPPVEVFQKVLDFDASITDDRSANYYQCLSISAAVCGQYERADAFALQALEAIRTVSSLEFSALRYLRVSPVEFAQDTEALRAAIRAHQPPAIAVLRT